MTVPAHLTRSDPCVPEKFDQAISDYTAGLDIKSKLLPHSSRQIAEVHYKLSIVLDLTSGRLGDSITHAERALDSVEARLAELRDALNGQGGIVTDESSDKADAKGKGKAKGPRLTGSDSIHRMTQTQMEAEVKDLQGLREDLALKVCTLVSHSVLVAEVDGVGGRAQGSTRAARGFRNGTSRESA